MSPLRRCGKSACVGRLEVKLFSEPGTGPAQRSADTTAPANPAATVLPTFCEDTTIGPLLSSWVKYKRSTFINEFIQTTSYSVGAAGSRGAVTLATDISFYVRQDVPPYVEHQDSTQCLR